MSDLGETSERSEASKSASQTIQKAMEETALLEDQGNEGVPSEENIFKDTATSDTQTHVTSTMNIREFVERSSPITLGHKGIQKNEDSPRLDQQTSVNPSLDHTEVTEDDKPSSFFKIVDCKGPAGIIKMVAVEQPKKNCNNKKAALQKEVICLIKKNQCGDAKFSMTADKIDETVGKLSDKMLRIIKCFSPYFKIVMTEEGVSLEEKEHPETGFSSKQDEVGSLSMIEEIEGSLPAPKLDTNEENGEIRRVKDEC